MKAVSIILIACVGVILAGNDSEELRLIKELSQRVSYLESRDRLYAQKVSEHEIMEQIYIEQLRVMEANNKAQEAKLEDLKKQLEEKDEETTKLSEVKRNRRNSHLRRQAELESPVAFFATLGNHFHQASVNQTFIFEQVVTNVGGAYDKSVGLFVAPYDGIYVFSTTLVSWNEISAHASFFKNNQPINIMFVSGRVGAADTSSATIILELQKGDNVTVRNGADGGVSYYGSNHSLFSGFLLHEVDSNIGNVVVGK